MVGDLPAVCVDTSSGRRFNIRCDICPRIGMMTVIINDIILTKYIFVFS